MNAHRFRILAFGVAALSMSAAAKADIIGIDFNLGGSTNQSPASTDVVGPVASAGWNNNVDLTHAPFFATADPTNAGTSLLTLKDNLNANTTAQFGMDSGHNALNGSTNYSPGYGATGSANATLSPDQQLYNGATYAGRAAYTQEISLFNVPYASYSVYVLAVSKDGAPGYPPPTGGYGSVTDYTNYNPSTKTATKGTAYWFYSHSSSILPSAGFSYLQATGTTQATSTAGANYALFSGLTGGSGTSAIFDLASPDADGNGGTYISGLEIVDTSAAVPEPASLGLILTGGMALLARRRRNAKAV